MRRIAGASVVALAVLAGLAGSLPARAATTATMVGGGWIGVGNPDIKVHVQVHLPCPGADVGFDPQPGAPGRLDVRQGASRFTLEAVEAASCSNNLHQGSGTGSCDGVRGFIIDWHLADGALGGPDTREDRVALEIRGPGEACSLTFAGPLGRGNLKLQADGPR